MEIFAPGIPLGVRQALIEICGVMSYTLLSYSTRTFLHLCMNEAEHAGIISHVSYQSAV